MLSVSVCWLSLFHSCPGVAKSGLPRSQSESATGFSGGSRRHGRSRDEQRRHTISNGVDYGMVSVHTHTHTPTSAVCWKYVKGLSLGVTPWWVAFYLKSTMQFSTSWLVDRSKLVCLSSFYCRVANRPLKIQILPVFDNEMERPVLNR